MKHRMVGLLLIVTSIAFSQPPVEKSLLWSISGKGLVKPSYLFGTIHMICEKDMITTDSLRAKFALAEQVAFEIKVDDPQLEAKMLSISALPEGKILKDYTTAEEYKIIYHYLRDTLRFDFEKYETRKPQFIMEVMTWHKPKCRSTGWEIILSQEAKKQKKEVLGLKTIEDEFALFDRKPINVQMLELVALLRDNYKLKDIGEQTYKYYEEQDIAKLSAMIDSVDSKPFKEFENVILTERTESWIPVIQKLISAKSTFIAVGAAHLGGEYGLIALLRAKGYIVKPVWQ